MDLKFEDRALSYHIFLLPFYSAGGELNASLSDKWDKDTLTDTQISSSDEERKLDYATSCYFTPEARKLLFNSENSFMYRLGDDAQFYEIKKDGVNYRLSVKKITVTVFDKNIGVLALHTEFHLQHQDESMLRKLTEDGHELNDERVLEAIRTINEHGRRINLPYIGTVKCGEEYKFSHSLVADSISLFGETEDFAALSKALYLGTGEYPMTGYIMKPIMQLLRSLFDRTDIAPVVDDRMYVCSLVVSEPLSDRIREASADSRAQETATRDRKADLFTDPALSESIYALGFIDKDTASCSLEMREKILRRCVNNRWQSFGTIDIVTHHSFVRIVGNTPDHVINSFVTQYVYLATGALMQRAEILWLSNRSAERSREYFELHDHPETADNRDVSDALTELKRRYVYAQNNIFLNQLTVQEQGVETFEMLKHELYIDDSLEKLDRTINCIYDFTTEFAEERENTLLSAITKLGLPLAIIQTFTVLLSFAWASEWELQQARGATLWIISAIQLGLLVLISAAAWLISHHYIKRKEKENRSAKRKKTESK